MAGLCNAEFKQARLDLSPIRSRFTMQARHKSSLTQLFSLNQFAACENCGLLLGDQYQVAAVVGRKRLFFVVAKSLDRLGRCLLQQFA